MKILLLTGPADGTFTAKLNEKVLLLFTAGNIDGRKTERL